MRRIKVFFSCVAWPLLVAAVFALLFRSLYEQNGVVDLPPGLDPDRHSLWDPTGGTVAFAKASRPVRHLGGVRAEYLARWRNRWLCAGVQSRIRPRAYCDRHVKKNNRKDPKCDSALWIFC